MSAALISAGRVEARPLPWTRLWHNSQAVAVTVALHSAVIAFLVLGWSMEHEMAAPAPDAAGAGEQGAVGAGIEQGRGVEEGEIV